MKEMKPGDESPIGCPKCGIAHKLIVRTNRHTGDLFLGCCNWPNCHFTQNVPDSVRMRMEGQPELFEHDDEPF